MKTYQLLCMFAIFMLATSLSLEQIGLHLIAQTVQRNEQIQDAHQKVDHDAETFEPDVATHDIENLHESVGNNVGQSHQLLTNLYAGGKYYHNGVLAITIKQIYGYGAKNTTYFRYIPFSCSRKLSCSNTNNTEPCCPCNIPTYQKGLAGNALLKFNSEFNKGKRCLINKLLECTDCQKACSVSIDSNGKSHIADQKKCSSSLCQTRKFKLANCGIA